jgi:FkbM family methyltransferase
MYLKRIIKKIIAGAVKKLPFKPKIFLLKTLQENLSREEKLASGQNNVFLSLSHLLRYDYKPSYIIDVGAYVGEWTKEVFKVFPGADYIAVEPLPEKKNILKKEFKNMPVKIYNNLVGDRKRQDVRFYAMETGSSVFEELTSVERRMIHLDMITLDDIAEQENVKGSVVLKLDVQGFELEVLKGAEKLLDHVDIICMEVSFLNYNDGAPLAHEVIQKMHELNYCIYDIPSFTRKDNDYALVQSDIIFLKSDGELRKKINNLKKDFHLFFS